MKTLEIQELLKTRELKKQIDELLRLIQKEGQTIEVTNHGEVVAQLVPTSKPKQSVEESDAAAWAKLMRIAEELTPYWPADVDAVEAVRDVRREL